MRRWLGLCALLPVLSTPAGAQQLAADLTDHFVAITAGFTG